MLTQRGSRFTLKIAAAVALLVLLYSATVGDHPAVAMPGSGPQVVSLGKIGDPGGRAMNVLLLYDPSTGEIWGYPEHAGMQGKPVFIGRLVKLGQPLAK